MFNMSIDKLKAFSKDTVVPISLSLMLALVVGVWTLAVKMTSWETRLTSIEQSLQSRWTFYMALDAWREYKANNPEAIIPDLISIRSIYGSK